MRGYRRLDTNPHPGDLNKRVVIGYTENVKNKNGYPEPVDTVVCTVWAATWSSGSQDSRAADTKNIEQETNFIIRHRDDVKKGMWVRFEGVKWSIIATDPYNYSRQYLGLRASAVKGVAG